ncbi:MAG: acylphosphatase [Chloroflexi bacterium]|nr:acylphosphatase [Chloroflexota bacterium]
MACVHAIVSGRVQRVGFRFHVLRVAQHLGVTGYVRNLPNGRQVEVWAEGEGEPLEELLAALRQGPPGARVEDVDVQWPAPTASYSRFQVKY